jgi:DNA polymerase-3 subunit alpha
MLDRAVQLKMPAVAITEHGNLFSSVIFHDQARKRGINPILGCEVYVAPGDRRTRSGTPGETANHLVLLAETKEGYHNLIKLVSAGYTEGFYYKPRIDKEILAQHAKGLIGLSSCLKGEVATGIRTEQSHKAVQAAAAYRDILGRDNFFLEMQYQGIDEQRTVNIGLQPIANDLGLSLVVTNDVHYLNNSDYKAHDVLLCIGTGKSVNDAERLRYHGDQFYMKTPEEMAQVFADFPEALRTTVRIAERCNVDLSGTVNHLPNFDVPAGFTLDEYFEHMVREGFTQRLPRLQELAAAGTLTSCHTSPERHATLLPESEQVVSGGLKNLYMAVSAAPPESVEKKKLLLRMAEKASNGKELMLTMRAAVGVFASGFDSELESLVTAKMIKLATLDQLTDYEKQYYVAPANARRYVERMFELGNGQSDSYLWQRIRAAASRLKILDLAEAAQAKANELAQP